MIIGAKNKQGKKQNAVTIELNPVFPPAWIPAELSINTVAGAVPNKLDKNSLKLLGSF